LLLLALRHDLAVHFVRGNAELTRWGGVAAVLPRPEPSGQVSGAHPELGGQG
jgi:hypothetical protein